MDLSNIVRISEDRMLSMLIRDRNHSDYCFFSTLSLVKSKPAIQCLIHPLSLLVTEKLFNSKLYGEEMPIRWTKAAILNTIKLQNSNGTYGDKSESHWTPIITYHTTMAYRKMAHFFEEDEKQKLEISLIKAGDFLSKVKLKDYLRIVENIIALYELFKLTGNRKYDNQASKLLLSIIKKQHNTGFIESTTGFDVRKHFVLVELLSKYHFLNKTDVSKGVLKSSILLLSHLQRPDGTVENELFEYEDFLTTPGHILHMSKEFPQTISLINGMIESSEKLGGKIIPYQDILPFSLSVSRLFSTYKLMFENKFFEIGKREKKISSLFFKELSIVIIEMENFKMFINPYNSRIKIFSNCNDNKSLIYSDSGFMLTINNIKFVQKEKNENHSLIFAQDQINFTSILNKEKKKNILSFKGSEISYDRTIEFKNDKITITSKFYLKNLKCENIEFHRIYRKINRMFRIEDIKIPSREDLKVNHTLVENCITHKEILIFKENRWLNKISEDISI